MPSQPTVIDLKTAFLRTQILLLSQPLYISPDVLTEITTGENELRQKAIDEALAKLNTQIRKHNKLVYGPQAVRHVAEQIDRLYWNAGERGVIVGGGEALEWVEKGVDYREEDVIAQLPTSWSEEAATRAPEQSAKFEALQKRLVEANEKRKQAREKLERYRVMNKLVGAFGEDAGVQDNLVTKRGEVERELERMRMLMLRVERGLEGLEEKEVSDNKDVDVDMDEDERLKAVLGT